ncbi:MAG: biotin--[acetyl-CoA-carboxylase] ligase [Nitrospinae bacterium]|nr:biotin--[acetyl-CoA-carboxylase] ligase [Nitrospinota bacterium]
MSKTDFECFSRIKKITVNEKQFAFEFHQSTTSTNDLAKACKTEEIKVFLARSQTAGRGRFNREWISPKDSGLFFSVYIPSSDSSIQKDIIPIRVATALHKVFKESYNLKTTIKWPNDIYVDNKKLAGILVESVAKGNHIEKIIIGVGINLFKPNKESICHQIQELPIQPQFLNELVDFSNTKELLEIMLTYIDKQLKTTTTQETVNYWNQNSNMLGNEYTIHYLGNRLSGTIKGINNQGNLILFTGDEVIELSSSDATFSPTM